MTENNIKNEQITFELKRKYEKELHSNETSGYTLGCLLLLAIFSLVGCENTKKPYSVQKNQPYKNICIIESVRVNG